MEKQILDQILDNTKYDTRIAPEGILANGSSGPVVVSTNMYLRKIEYICTARQQWKPQITFRHQWKDPRVVFDDKKGQIKYLTLEQYDRIWKPDTFISNSLLTESHTDLKQNILIRIYPNGDVLLSTRLTVTASCPMDLLHYPFDSQKCLLQFASCELLSK